MAGAISSPISNATWPNMLSSEARAAAPVFAALGDETRLRLVMKLCNTGRQSITQLSEREPLTRQAVTKHLRVLSGAGLVRVKKEGREQVWEMTPGKMKQARRWLKSIEREWDQRLDRLKALVEEPE
jgi:DNA-binding transcriptional ArsR family regulator